MFIKPWYRVLEENDGDGGGDAGGGGGNGNGAGDGNDTGGGEGAGGSGGEGGGGGDGGASAEARVWPDNWRDQLADHLTKDIKDETEKGERREKLAKRLDRFASPLALGSSYFALDGKVSSGELKAPLPENATEEQIAAYRKENGIPEKPEEYLNELPDGLVIGDDDKAEISRYLEAMHAENMPAGTAQRLIQAYNEAKEERLTAIEEADSEHAVEIEDTLRAEYGGDYRQNIGRVQAMLDAFPEEVQTAFASARMPDGRALLNVPGVMQELVGLAREMIPSITLPGKGDESNLQSIEAAIAEIEEVMRTDRAKYNKDEAMQKRYRELLSAQEKVKEREKSRAA